MQDSLSPEPLSAGSPTSHAEIVHLGSDDRGDRAVLLVCPVTGKCLVYNATSDLVSDLDLILQQHRLDLVAVVAGRGEEPLDEGADDRLSSLQGLLGLDETVDDAEPTVLSDVLARPGVVWVGPVQSWGAPGIGGERDSVLIQIDTLYLRVPVARSEPPPPEEVVDPRDPTLGRIRLDVGSLAIQVGQLRVELVPLSGYGVGALGLRIGDLVVTDLLFPSRQRWNERIIKAVDHELPDWMLTLPPATRLATTRVGSGAGGSTVADELEAIEARQRASGQG